MIKYTKEEFQNALSIISSTIANCEKFKFKLKFDEGTSQHSLLKNRLKALYISKTLIEERETSLYSMEDLKEALSPVDSIISKCEKAIKKFEEGNSSYNRFKKIIDAMYVSKSLIKNEISKRG